MSVNEVEIPGYLNMMNKKKKKSRQRTIAFKLFFYMKKNVIVQPLVLIF